MRRARQSPTHAGALGETTERKNAGIRIARLGTGRAIHLPSGDNRRPSRMREQQDFSHASDVQRRRQTETHQAGSARM